MKRFRLLLPLAGWLCLAHPALAIQDGNSNGLSDVWERLHNGGQLFSPSNPNHAPEADPDGDGWTNAQESLAGTDPFSPDPPDGRVPVEILRHPAAEALFFISWPTITGKTYHLFTSQDLQEWIPFDETIPGTGAPITLVMEATAEDGSIPDRLFWRVEIVDQDPDGDTLTTWEELALNLDPNSADSDLDGIRDDIDTQPLTNAVIADPDGLGLDPSFNNGLIGRWDFEQLALSPTRFADLSGNDRFAYTYAVGPVPGGIISKSALFNQSYFEIERKPSNNQLLLHGLMQYTVSFWMKVPPGAIPSDGNEVGLFTHYRYKPVSNGHFLMDHHINGVRVAKVGTEGTNVELRGGSFKYRNYKNQGGVLVFHETSESSGFTLSMPATAFEDDRWHHWAYVAASGVVGIYRDGVLLTSAGYAFNTIENDLYATVSFGRSIGNVRGAPTLGVQNPPPATFTGNLDRLRVWNRALQHADIKKLYEQDADSDGLFDITEASTRTWRDTASPFGNPADGEYSYLSSPFLWQPEGADSDGDGLTDHQEQNDYHTDIANPDTDGDLLPDGWEVAHGLDPLNPNGEHGGGGDRDGDLWINLDEYRHKTDPNDPASVGPPAIPAEEKVSIFLAVGDHSGSNSEQYTIECFEVDLATGVETPYYSLIAEEPGDDPSATIAFRKGRTYSFQLLWQGTNNASGRTSPNAPLDGPDFDYSFRVEPQGNHGGILIDSWSREGGVDTTRPLLALEANDVAETMAEFRRKYQDRRVLFCAGHIVADTDRDGAITDEDLQGKDTWTKERGAIYAVNFDRDGTNTTAGGLPAADAITWWNTPGVPQHESWRIDNDADAADITPFRIAIPDLPEGSKCYLTVASQEQRRAIHVFNGATAGKYAIWGGITENGRSWTDGDSLPNDIEITGGLNPVPSTNAPLKRGVYHFGLEGLAFRGMKVPGGTLPGGGFGGFVELGLQVSIPGRPTRLQWGKIKLKVAPFLLTPNDRPTDNVFVWNGTDGLIGMPASEGVSSGLPSTQGALSPWMQDHVEIGYTQRPGGPLTKMTFVCPYDGNQLAEWPRTHLLGADKGVFALGANPIISAGNYGGNIELLHSSDEHPLGRIVVGNTMNTDLQAFFQAQEAQPLVVPNIAYTEVEHIDEVLSPGPNDVTYVPGPAEAISLLQTQFDTEEKQVAAVLFTEDTVAPAVGKVWKSAASISTPYIITDLEYDNVIGHWSRFNRTQENPVGGLVRLVGGISGGQIARIKAVTKAVQADAIRIGNAGNPAGKLMLEVDFYFDTGSLASRNWKNDVPQQSSGWYRRPLEGAYVVCVQSTLQWKYGDSSKTNPALMTVKEILADNTFLTFNQTTLPSLIASTATAVGVTNPVKIPCLFYKRETERNDLPVAIAYTPNTANLQWVNSNPVNANPFGPRNASNDDVLKQAIQETLSGQSTFLDDWKSFHIQMGEVHCGSAAERTAEAQWWNK